MAKVVAYCCCENCGECDTKISTKYNRRDGARWVKWMESSYTLCEKCSRIEYRKTQEKDAIKNGLKTIRINYTDYKNYSDYNECAQVTDSYDEKTKTVEIYVNDEMYDEIKAWQEEEEAKKPFQTPMNLSYKFYKTYYWNLRTVKGSYDERHKTVDVLVTPEERKEIEDRLQKIEEEKIAAEKAYQEKLKLMKYIEIDYADYKNCIKKHFPYYTYNYEKRTAVLHLLPEDIKMVKNLLDQYYGNDIDEEIEEYINSLEEPEEEFQTDGKIIVMDADDDF